jgi:hypothetical protein
MQQQQGWRASEGKGNKGAIATAMRVASNDEGDDDGDNGGG